jgi:hypothetical protein
MCVFASKAQITITSSDMPSTGDTIRYSISNNIVDVGASGADQNWDYTYLTPSSQGLYEYKSSLSTPYILNFGFSALGLKIADSLGGGQLQLTNVYNFYKNSSSKWEGIGIGFQYAALPLPQSGKNSNTDIIYNFPLNYLDENTDDYAAKIPISLAIIPIGNLFQSGTRTTIVDGWGKISTPYAKNVDCIRVKSTIEAFDSISISTPAIAFGFPSTRIEYKWLSKTEKIPILEITGTKVGETFIPAQIRYRDKNQNITAPGAIEALFDCSDTMPFVEQQVDFNNLSTGFITDYLWSISPSTGFEYVDTTDETSENPSVKFTKPGLYAVSLRVSNFFQSDSLLKTDYIEVLAKPTIGDPTSEQLGVYPNPINDIVTFKAPLDQTPEFRLIDAAGRVVLKVQVRNGQTMDFSNMAAGYYIGSFRLNNAVINQTIIIN